MIIKITTVFVFWIGFYNIHAFNANDIPIVHTPIHFDFFKQDYVCGYGNTMPEPILANCQEPLAKDAVDLRGMWRDTKTFRLERIEQCGKRVVITSNGVIHDISVLGLKKIGVYDVAVKHLPKCELIAVYADFANNKSLNLYLPLKIGEKLVVSRTLLDANTIEINYNGEIRKYARVNPKASSI